MNTILTRARTLAASLTLGAALLAPASFAGAAQQSQAGVVNVQVGDVMVLNDAQIGAVVGLVATLCPQVSVDQIGVLAQQVDASGKKEKVCKTASGPVTIRQDR